MKKFEKAGPKIKSSKWPSTEVGSQAQEGTPNFMTRELKDLPP